MNARLKRPRPATGDGHVAAVVVINFIVVSPTGTTAREGAE
jgi:hypothetical protein